MIRFERVSFTYPDGRGSVLRDVDLVVPEGELCLVVGSTGTGKSTLLRAANGHVPRFTGGTLTGDVLVDGRSTRTWLPRDLADVVGVVGQDPAAGFVTDTVEDELAYVMENIGVPPDAMRRRVEDVLDLLDLHALRDRPLMTLSGGQQQRVAIGAVLTAHPRVLVLDEPTSALDPAAAEEVLAALTRLVHDLGITVLVAEHRLERVVQYADRVALVPGAGAPLEVGAPADVLARSPVAPPVVELGRLAGWEPIPLSVRDARRRAPGLRERLDGARPSPPPRVVGDVVASARRLSVAFGGVRALRDVDLELRRGEVVAVMGRNGAGKSTLLAHLAGLRAPDGGRVEVDGVRPHELSGRDALHRVALVPQDASLLLDAQSVEAECRAADHDAGRPAGAARDALERLVSGVDPAAHPRDLSEGQRLALALAVVLVAGPPVVLLDEPTRGLDYAAKHRLGEVLLDLAARGHAVVLATHDVEVVAAVADRVIVLADGDVVADGPARDVVTHSPVFAPQVAKVLAPLPWLTVTEVAGALGGGVTPAVRLRRSSSVLLAVASLLGIVAFTWPLFVDPSGEENLAHSGDAPWIFLALLPLLFAVVVAELSEGALDAKAVALLGVLAACGAALRLPGGVTGFEPMFFVFVPAGRVFGRGFGFVLGALTMFASALLTGGVGPWLPFQMFGAAWVGFGAGCLPPARGRAEILLLAAYAFVAGLVYGLLLNMWFWPYGASAGSELSFVPGAGLAENLRRFWGFHLATSLGWDLPRAVLNAVIVLLLGAPVLAALRRVARQAAFGAPVEFAEQ